MKRVLAALGLIAMIASPDPGRAEIGTADAVPAATLLLPYFEVDLGDPNGLTTLLSVNNASASAAIAQVTIWTDWGVPSFGFQVYLTGYDVQSINLRDVFNGNLPVTADAGADPGDVVSPKGTLSQDINFPGSVGPCGSSNTLYNKPDPTLAAKVTNLQRVHRGLSSTLDGQCWGATYGDNVVRGYVTIDSVTVCSLLFPSDPGYFSGISDSRNILWGDYIFVDPANNFSQGETLVHVESCSSPSVGNGAGHCPLVPGDYSFYGRYVGGAATDQREPIATTFAARYVDDANQSTDFLVWRDTKLPPSGSNGRRPCGATPSWFPLSQTDVVAFDEQENAEDLCFLPDNVSPAIGGPQTCFPLATQRVHVAGGNTIAFDMAPSAVSGWIYLNLNHTVAGDPLPGVAQASVATVRSRAGRFSVGYEAVQLDNALTTSSGGVSLIP